MKPNEEKKTNGVHINGHDSYKTNGTHKNEEDNHRKKNGLMKNSIHTCQKVQ